MRVARLYDFDDIRVEEEPVPDVGKREVLVKTVACGICSGDILPWYIKRKAPLVIGHEPVGVITQVGSEVNDFQVGDRVFAHHHAPCFKCKYCARGDYSVCETWRQSRIIPGGIAEYFVVPEVNLPDALKLPDSVSFEDGVLIEPTACVVRSLRKGGLPGNIQPVRAHDRQSGEGVTARSPQGSIVLIIGLGIMGQLHALVSRAYGAQLVIGVDKISSRCQMGLETGCDHVLNASYDDVFHRVSEITGGEMTDIVIIGPGSSEAMKLGLACTGRGARVILFTPTPPGEQLPVEPYRLYMNEISILPSYSCGPNDSQEALRLVEAGIIRADRLAIHTFPLEQTREAFKAMAEARIVKAVIRL